MLIKKFNAYIVAKSDHTNIIASLGAANIYVYEYTDTTAISYAINNDITAVDFSAFKNKFDTPELLAQVNVTGTFTPLNAAASYLQSAFPLVIAYDFSQYTTSNASNYCILLTDNDSGYYAVSENCPMNYGNNWNSYTRAINWTLYDNNDNVIVSNNMVYMPLSGIESLTIRGFQIENGVIMSNACYRFDLNMVQGQMPKCTTEYKADSISNALLTWLNGCANTEPQTDLDPYAAGGTSTVSTSAGSFANTGTDVAAPGLASMDPSASGFMKAFNPSGAQLNTFAQWLWNTFDITTLQQLYSNPMEAVIGLLAVPVSPTVGASQTINLGNVTTSASAPIITNRFKKEDFGSVTIPEWWGAYLDYEPYTQVSIFLPYIGVQQLDTNDVMGKSVHVYYYVDVLSGACLAVLEVDGKALYHFPGQCGVQIPVTASSFGNVLQSALSVASSALQSIASQASGNFQSVSEVATSVFSGAKTRTQRSGQVGSAAGFMDNQTPFFIVQRPVQCRPADQNQFTGYPAFITYTLSDLIGTGYTEIESVRLTNVPATADELTELDAVLKAGVVL